MATKKNKTEPQHPALALGKSKVSNRKKKATVGEPRPRGPAVDADGLTPKQALVRDCLLEGDTFGEAAARCEVSHSYVAELVRTSLMFQKAYRRGQDRLRMTSKVTVDHLIEELCKLSFIRAHQFFGENGDLLPVSEWTDEMSAQIAGVDIEALWEGNGEERTMIGYTKKLKFWPKVEAIDKLARILGGYKADREQGGTIVQVGVVIVPAKAAVAANEDVARANAHVIEGKPSLPAVNREAFRLLGTAKKKAP